MLLRHSAGVVFFKVLIASFRVNFFSPQNSYCGGIAVQKEFKDSLVTFNQIILFSAATSQVASAMQDLLLSHLPFKETWRLHRLEDL